jgi:isopenicillin N synthase-like dioxygenase
MSHVPVVDLSADPAVVGADLARACESVGAFQIIGHGISDAVTDRAWTAMTRFFELSIGERMSVASPPGYPYGYGSFSGVMAEAGSGVQPVTDFPDVFSIGPAESPEKRTVLDDGKAWQPNLWPAALPDLREAWTQYFDDMLYLGSRVMGLFARGLGLSAGYFGASVDRSPSSLHGVRYPAHSSAPVEGQPRTRSHDNDGLLTILKQDAIGGLQVRGENGEWTEVEPIPSAFVVTVGDLLARWTNDRWHSAAHRVVELQPALDGTVPRHHTLSFSHHANWDAVVVALPGTGSPKYAPVLAGPYLHAKLATATETPPALKLDSAVRLNSDGQPL